MNRAKLEEILWKLRSGLEGEEKADVKDATDAILAELNAEPARIKLDDATVPWLEQRLQRLSTGLTCTVPRTEREALKWLVGDALSLSLRKAMVAQGALYIEITDVLSADMLRTVTSAEFELDGTTLRFEAIEAEHEYFGGSQFDVWLSVSYKAT